MGDRDMMSNLRLVTWAVNAFHGHADRKSGTNNKQSKALIQLTKDGELITEHHSTMNASRVTGVDRANISACCHGKYKSAGGFVWRFV